MRSSTGQCPRCNRPQPVCGENRLKSHAGLGLRHCPGSRALSAANPPGARKNGLLARPFYRYT